MQLITPKNIFNSEYQNRLCQNIAQYIFFTLCHVLALLKTKFALMLNFIFNNYLSIFTNTLKIIQWNNSFANNWMKGTTPN